MVEKIKGKIFIGMQTLMFPYGNIGRIGVQYVPHFPVNNITACISLYLYKKDNLCDQATIMAREDVVAMVPMVAITTNFSPKNNYVKF